MLYRLSACVLGLTAATFATVYAVGQTNDDLKPDVLRDEIVVGEPLEYSIIIREKNGDVSHEHVLPRMHSANRTEVFAGLPLNDKEPRNGSTHRAFVTAKVIGEKDGVAEVHCTIGQSLNFQHENDSTTWTEKKLSSNRNIRFGETIKMNLPPTNLESPEYECSITIARHSR